MSNVIDFKTRRALPSKSNSDVPTPTASGWLRTRISDIDPQDAVRACEAWEGFWEAVQNLRRLEIIE